MENTEKIKIMDSVLEMLNRGSEAVIRKRSKNGDRYIEVVEQRYKETKKYKIDKN